ncbi:hypothetical protein AAHC03_017073 [Spirometra sp. Aus1]|nr:unnamed protein product [Spirometra erinaceieuropaei]
MPTLLKICLAVSAVDYTRFTRENYVRTHTLEAYNFLYTIRVSMVDHYFKFFALIVVSHLSGDYISSLCEGLAVHTVVLLFSKFSLLPVLIRLYAGVDSLISTESTLPRLVARLRGPFSRIRTRTYSASTSVPNRVSDMRMPVFPCSDSESPRFYTQLPFYRR